MDAEYESEADTSRSSTGPGIWINEEDDYIPPNDIQFTAVSGISSGARLVIDTAPIDIFKTLVTDEFIELMTTKIELMTTFAEQFI